MNLKNDIRRFSVQELEAEFEKLSEPKFRAKQVHEWLWKKSARSFDEMTNLSKDLRTKLSEQFAFYSVTENIVQKSQDGTIKLGMKLHDERLLKE